MKRLLFLIMALLLVAGCGQLPKIVPLSDPLSDNSDFLLTKVFPTGRWQLTHTIEATVPGGVKKSALIGVSVLSSADRSVSCALMTVEGFVLFAGRYAAGTLTVERAVSPFDRQGFAKGLLDDLILLFFKPDQPLLMSGIFTDGGRVTRFHSPEGEVTDVVVSGGDRYEIHKYSSGQSLERSIEARGLVPLSETSTSAAFAADLTLRRQGLLGYELHMRLVEALPLP